MTCATRVTRGTIDFQARDNFELRAGSFTSNFQSPFRCGALKVTFKQKLISRAIPPQPIALLYISPFLHGQNPELFLQRHAMLI